MHILFSINHPSQYHMFKNLAFKLREEGHEVIFFIQSREIIEQLVKSDGFSYRFSVSKSIRERFKSRIGIIIRSFITVFQQEVRIIFYCLKNNVDFLLGTDIAISHVGFLLRKPAFVFTDDDYVFTKQYCHLAYPFARHIIAPIATDTHKWLYKKIAYLGTQKSAYLHPKYFKPDINVLVKYNLTNTRYFVIRLVNYNALHDSIHNAKTGFNDNVLDGVISLLENKGQVLLSAEGDIKSKYSKYILKIEPNDMHSIIYYADMFIGDSQSMHIEAALLGTPSIRSNKWVISKNKVNVIEYLESLFGLGISIAPGDNDALFEKVELYSNPEIKKEYGLLNKKFFNENTNLTDFLFWILSKYPESISEYKNNQNIVKEFK